MRVFNTQAEALAGLGHQGPLVACIGNFDGVHLGHRKLLELAVAQAREQGLPSLAVTFWPHPYEFFGKADFKYLCAPDKKLELLADCGLDYVCSLPFNHDLAKLSAREFFQTFLSPLGLSRIFVGFNFRMGHDQPDLAQLRGLARSFAIKLQVVGAVMYLGQPISSTRIRAALRDGDLSLANTMLGRWHSVRGMVLHGHGRGGPLLNMPTANLDPGLQLMPVPAVYATCATFPGLPEYTNQIWPSLTSFGKNPTFGGQKLSLETHLLDFNADIYGQVLEVSFLHKLRAERKFSSAQQLSEQLFFDVEQRREFIAKGDDCFS